MKGETRPSVTASLYKPNFDLISQYWLNVEIYIKSCLYLWVVFFLANHTGGKAVIVLTTTFDDKKTIKEEIDINSRERKRITSMKECRLCYHSLFVQMCIHFW